MEGQFRNFLGLWVGFPVDENLMWGEGKGGRDGGGKSLPLYPAAHQAHSFEGTGLDKLFQNRGLIIKEPWTVPQHLQVR